MNVYFKVLLLIIVAVGAYFFGHGVGVNSQKVADQKIFDKINSEVAAQKAEANTKYRALVLEKIALMVETEKLISTLGKEREDNRQITDDLTRKYSGVVLRFGTAKNTGLGDRCRSAEGVVAKTDANSSATEVVQLPDGLAADLRRLVAKADFWLDEYRACHAYVEQVRCQ